jgi:serine/threonine protein kinase
MNNHLSDDEFSRLLASAIADDEADQVEEHLRLCAECREAARLRTEPAPDLTPLFTSAANNERLVPNETLDTPPAILGYEILEQLGSGGMGIVWKARQLRPMRFVALKILRPGPLADADVLRRFLSESEALAQLLHPGIVQVYEVGEWKAQGTAVPLPYFSMEFCAGRNLAEKLAGSPIPPAEAAAVVEAAARAVHHAHQHGIVHRDLKPANVLLASWESEPSEALLESGSPRYVLGYTPKVSDFGLAKSLTSESPHLTRSGALLGTPSYVAPEQVEGTSGPLADVYSLGAILYECFTGRPPFKAATVLETLELARTTQPVPVRLSQPRVPRDLETICLKCLEKEPDRRYGSALELADDLRRWRLGLPVHARRVSAMQQVGRMARRYPVTSALSAALVTTLIAGILALLSLWYRSELARRRAEAAQKAAEANFEVANRSLRDLAEFARETLSDPAFDTSVPAFLDAALEEARTKQLQLAEGNPSESKGKEQLAIFDELLGEVCRIRGRFDKARLLFKESSQLWEESIPLGSDVEDARTHQLVVLSELARMRQTADDPLIVDSWSAQAQVITERLIRSRRHVGKIFRLSEDERKLADALVRRRAQDQSNRLLEASLRRFEALARQQPHNLEIRLCKALTLAAQGKHDDMSTIAAQAAKGPTLDDPSREMVVRALTELAARSFGLTQGAAAPVDPAGRTKGPDELAQHFLVFLDERCRLLRLDSTSIPEIAWRMRELVLGAATDCRYVGKLPEARQITDRLQAIAQLLVRSYPNRPEPLFLLCDSYHQHAKNAWKTNDLTIVEQSLRQSLEAANRAFALAPDSEVAHQFVVDRRKRLAGLENGH